MTKAKVEVKLINGADERKFSQRQEQRKKRKLGDAILTDQFKTYIVSINNVEVLQQIYGFIDNLPVRDSRFIRNTYNKLTPALELKHDFNCTSCGFEQEVEVPITAQFFWPDA